MRVRCPASSVEKLLFLFVLSAIPLLAQQPPELDQGIKPYGAYQHGDIDSVNVANGNVTVHIPLFSLPQRGGKLKMGFDIIYNNKSWYVWKPTTTSYAWKYGGGAMSVTPLQSVVGNGSLITTTDPYGTIVRMHHYSLITQDGSSHEVGITSTPDNGVSGTGETLDGSGFHLGSTAVIDRDGIQYAGGLITDPNGNQIAFNSSTGWTDTLGRTIPVTYTPSPGTYGTFNVETPGVPSATTNCPAGTATALELDLPAYSGSTAIFKFCFADFHIQTSFNIPGDTEYSGTFRLMNAVVLPNLTLWQFNYNSYADLTSITFPTGGSISYSWSNSNFTGTSRVVTQRTVNANDGTGPHTWNYQYGVTVNGVAYLNVLTDPSSNDTVLTPCFNYGYICKSQYYSGSSSTGTLLKTTSTQYGFAEESNYDTYTGHVTYINVFPTSETTTWANGLTKQTNTSYDSGFTYYIYNPTTDSANSYTGYYATPTLETFSDYGQGAPGAILKQNSTSYQWQSDSNYLTANLLDSVSASKVLDSSGNKCAETDYTYDNASYLTASNISTQHGAAPGPRRGNISSITKQLTNTPCNSASTWQSLTSYVNAYDTGTTYQSIDPKGYTTTYTYSPNFYGAYVTQTNLPTTGSTAHIVSGNYDFNTGLLSSFTDQNNKTSTYAYDTMWRITSASFPDGGQTSFTYNNSLPASAVATKKITGSLNQVQTVNFDGLGRTTQTQLNSDPDGVDYADTTYDGLGRVWKVSNPHRSSGLSSDGTTTNYFDALGRPCLVVPPDGTLPSGNPCASQPSNTVFTAYSGNAVTVTDQVGNNRRSVSDGLGRLIEVDEPGGASPVAGTGSASVSGSEQSIGGTPAKSGTGSVTFSGTLQSKQVISQAATSASGAVTFNGTLQSKQVQTSPGSSGSGTVAITGAEQTTLICAALEIRELPQACNYRVYDAGTVSIIVNGFTATVNYGRYDTANTVASGLNTALNASSSPVTSSVSGATLTLTAKATGTASNYSVSGQSATTEGDFAGPSFYASPNNPTLTGGKNGTYNTIYDSGTCTITVNSHGDSTSWSGSGTTTSSIALALASSIAGDSGASVNASPSGGTVNLTAKTAGSTTNYSLSSSCSYDSSNFSGPSFSTSNSGSSLSGGKDPVYTTLYDSGSSTITVNGHADSVSWSGSGTTTSSIASALVSNINADSGASITASASGAIVSITAKSTGANTNYSLSSSSTYDSTDFSGPSFSSSNSGSTLTGGINGTSTVYDSGSVWIKVAGFKATVSYGQSDTTNSIVTGLANALSVASSPVTARISGTNVNLTAKAVGANTNFTLSGGSSTNQSSSFSHASFTISVSGSTLTGGSSPTLSLSTPAITTYNYDPVNNLVSITQSGSRQRTFSYDSLSRLLCASNPENSSAACPSAATSYTPGTTGYSYDANGNLTAKTAPAPNQPATTAVTTTYSYDALNRLTQKSYSDGTPTVNYGYDGVAPPGCTLPSLTIGNGIGKRTGMCDAAGAEAWSYDIVSGTGWKTTDKRTTEGVTPTSPAIVQNNLDGSTNSITYPSGHVLSYGPGGAGRPLSVTDTSTNVSYAASAHYWPSGVLGTLSNSGSISFTSILNSRLQPCWMYGTTGTPLPWNSTACTATTTTGNVLDLKYNYNLGSADNGNVVSITNNRDTTRSQNFGYDSLNRLVTAQTTATYATSAGHCWGESFAYDAWGNLLSVSESASSYDGCTYEQPQGWTITANNRIQSTATCFDSSGNLLTVTTYCYDAVGNLLTDTSKSYGYNAENLLKSIPMLGISYVYDGDGRRVAKLNSSGAATKLYWYGLGSDPLDETDGTGATNNSSFFEYPFFNSTRVARRDASNNVIYYFADHLGTARVIANTSGTILDDSDFYPFGGERFVSSSSGNHYKFTGKERDSESGLDDFGDRYYSSPVGRFTSIDPIWVKIDRLADPQRLNLYAYARNNPLLFTDPDGGDITLGRCSIGSAQDCFDQLQAGLNKQDRDHVRLVTGDGKNGCDKGVSCVIVDANYKSDSKNFQVLQTLANDHSATATLDVLKPSDKFDLRTTISINVKTGEEKIGTMSTTPGFDGYTFFPYKKGDPGPFSADDITHAVINSEPSDKDIPATIHHEMRHIFLGDFGRSAKKAQHGRPGVDQQTKAAENEAKRNEKEN